MRKYKIHLSLKNADGVIMFNKLKTWQGTARYGLVRRGLAWFGKAGYGVVRYGRGSQTPLIFLISTDFISLVSWLPNLF